MSTFLGLLRSAALMSDLIGAAGSVGLMLYASRRQDSLLLKSLFTIWVLSPFVALMWAHIVSKHWPTTTQTTLYGVMLILTVGSLAVYGGFISGRLRAKAGFIFLVVPGASWLLTAIAIPVAGVVSSRWSRR